MNSNSFVKPMTAPEVESISLDRVGDGVAEVLIPPIHHSQLSFNSTSTSTMTVDYAEGSLNSTSRMMLDESSATIGSSSTGLITKQNQINVGGMMNKSHFLDKSRTPTGLAWVALADTILIELKPSHCSCDWDMKYNISIDDGVTAHHLFTAVEELQCCSFGSLQNIVLRDNDNVPVGRVCYKEKSFMTGKLAIAVYSPPDLLLGTGEEYSHFGLCYSPRFQLRNSDGEKVFVVEYTRNLWPNQNQFLISSSDGNTDLARILNKSKNSVRLHFSTKLSLTLKMILLGFCIAILHKSYRQPFVTSEPTEKTSTEGQSTQKS